MQIAIYRDHCEQKLRQAAREQPHPYKLLQGSAGYLLLIEGVSPRALQLLQERLGEAQLYEVLEEGCPRRE